MITGIVLAFVASSPMGELAIAPAPREKMVRLTGYNGEVLAVTKETITIRGRDQYDKTGPEAIRTFKGVASLIAGQQDPVEATNFDYRLSDVKVGDKVITRLRATGDDDLCLTIRILRRPGGLVPPAPFESADVPHKYHNDANAYQAFEERGVPLPLRLDEDYQRKLEEAIQREHAAFRKRRDHTAPPPRPVVRK